MTRIDFQLFDPLLPAADADGMLRLCERFGRYGTYAEEAIEEDFAPELAQRYDAAINFVKTGGRFGRKDGIAKLAARTNYFRETYAYGARPAIAGIEPFLFHEGFVEAARVLHGRPVIEPAIVFANLLVPGQELAVHTDVPEFRGVNRKRHPQWLIVAMRHSGLFESWRMPIATGVAWFHDCRGGEFAFYPDGAERPPRAHSVRYNTALLLDTDSVFHGVDRVAEAGGPIAPLRPGMRLCFAGDRRWEVRDGERVVARYRWEDLRFSVSWKAYCFADQAERDAWAAHGDDLAVDVVVERMLADMRSRGVVGTEAPGGQELVDLIIDTYVHYPTPASH